MKVVSAAYLKSALRAEDFPRDRRPEVAFVGRSNVGKSSLLNALLNRKGLAKTSGTPGKTQTVNFFDVNGACYFVDLPGYGYAKVAPQLKEAWQRHMAAYLRDREPLRLAAALIDSRHAPTAKDHEMLALLEDAAVPTVIVATKVDKLKNSERARNLRRIREDLELDDEALVLPCSSQTGEGVRELLRVIGDALGV